MGLRILITGGLGFLGHHLSRVLLEDGAGCEVTLVDNLSSTRIDYAWLKGRAEVRVEDFAASSWEGRRFDRIYHLASPVGSLGILRETGYIAKKIVDLAVRAGEVAVKTGASLLYVSSSEIYGKAGLQEEGDTLMVPVATGARMEYSLGKLAAEHLLKNLSLIHGFRLTVVRPFNVIGEQQSSRSGFVVPIFFENALAGKPLPIFYGGGQERCLCHAEDLVAGLIAVQESGRSGETYNLGNPANRIRIRDLACRIRALCGSDSALETVDPGSRFGEQFLEAPAKVPSIEKARGHAGWKPRIGLDASLKRIFRHYSMKSGGDAHGEDTSRVPAHPAGRAAAPA